MKTKIAAAVLLCLALMGAASVPHLVSEMLKARVTPVPQDVIVANADSIGNMLNPAQSMMAPNAPTLLNLVGASQQVGPVAAGSEIYGTCTGAGLLQYVVGTGAQTATTNGVDWDPTGVHTKAWLQIKLGPTQNTIAIIGTNVCKISTQVTN